MRKFGVVILKSLKPALVVIAFSFATVVAYEVPVSARSFSSCDAVLRVFPHGVAQNASAQSAVARRLGLGVSAIPVRPVVYRKNIRLDADGDGVICEEQRERLVGVAIGIDIFRCMLRTSGDTFGCCWELRKSYPDGVARDASSRGVGWAAVDARLYSLNSSLDSNRNGVACDTGDSEF